MSVAVVSFLDQVVPLELTIEQEGVGGVTGKSPTVRVRDATTVNSYLDFGDNTFKTGAWITQNASLSEVGRGHYTRSLDLGLITALSLGNVLVAEYFVNDGGDVVGEDHDLIVIGQETLFNSTIVRKAVTNRQEEFSGSPGRIILFEDNGVTKAIEQELRDEAGGGIVTTVGSPAKRTASVI